MDLAANDTELATRLAEIGRGNDAAFAALYAATSAKLFGVIRRILERTDLAEEALQESYVRIWTNAKVYDSQLASPMTWMISIARNQAIDLRRRAAERVAATALALDDVQLVAPDGVATMDAGTDTRRLTDCLGKLEEQPRSLVLLAYTQGFSREELAARFARPVPTIKTVLRRALAALKGCLDG